MSVCSRTRRFPGFRLCAGQLGGHGSAHSGHTGNDKVIEVYISLWDEESSRNEANLYKPEA